MLVDALASLPGPNAPGLILMGVGEKDDAATTRIRAKLPGRVVTVPQFPLADLPSYLALADIIAVPSLDVPAARGQIPAKLFDALAMAKPVVASAVNDMAEIAEDAGLVTQPGDTRGLADAISSLANDQGKRLQLGLNGRKKFLAHYTHDAGRRVLRAAVSEAYGG